MMPGTLDRKDCTRLHTLLGLRSLQVPAWKQTHDKYLPGTLFLQRLRKSNYFVLGLHEQQDIVYVIYYITSFLAPRGGGSSFIWFCFLWKNLRGSNAHVWRTYALRQVSVWRSVGTQRVPCPVPPVYAYALYIHYICISYINIHIHIYIYIYI